MPPSYQAIRFFAIFTCSFHRALIFQKKFFKIPFLKKIDFFIIIIKNEA